VTGSFLLAFLLTAALKSVRFDSDLKLGLTTGFLGAFTTFSTFCKEVYLLINSRNYSITALYIILSVIFGFTAAYIGAVQYGN
jgi:CrcB protein